MAVGGAADASPKNQYLYIFFLIVRSKYRAVISALEFFQPNRASLASCGIPSITCSVWAPMQRLCEVYFRSAEAREPTSYITVVSAVVNSPLLHRFPPPDGSNKRSVTVDRIRIHFFTTSIGYVTSHSDDNPISVPYYPPFPSTHKLLQTCNLCLFPPSTRPET